MKNINSIFVLLLLSGFLVIWNGLQYFIGGEAFRNSDLRNYAVVGQIIFGIAVLFYGFWYQKTLKTRK